MGYGKRTKTIKDVKKYEETVDEIKHTTHSSVDETDSPGEVLDRVNEILSPHGLEIAEIDGNNAAGYPIVFTAQEIDSELHPVRFTRKQFGLIDHIMGHFSAHFDEEAEEFFETMDKYRDK